MAAPKIPPHQVNWTCSASACPQRGHGLITSLVGFAKESSDYVYLAPGLYNLMDLKQPL